MASSEKIRAPLSAVQEKGWQFLRGGLPNNLPESDAKMHAELCGIVYDDLKKVFDGALFDLERDELSSYALMQLEIYKNTPKQRCHFSLLEDYACKPRLWQKHLDAYGIEAPGNIYMIIAYAYFKNNDARILKEIWIQNEQDYKKRSFVFDLYYYFLARKMSIEA